MNTDLDQTFGRCADAIRKARALVITAGAGMGVDSGLPDFRGKEGFWAAYPPYRRLGLSFVQAANPVHFEQDPAFGWGFYGQRTNLYRETVPHAGFGLLQRWIDRFDLDAFVVTSNVDGQFQKAGFSEEMILEVHGSIHHLQCLTPCNQTLWYNREDLPVDLETTRCTRVPTCPRCGGVSRPNVLMFGDYSWIPDRSRRQEMRFDLFQDQHRGEPLVILEMGAGTSIPTIRHLTERLGSQPDAIAVRINPYEAHIGGRHLSLPCGALEGLTGIDRALDGG